MGVDARQIKESLRHRELAHDALTSSSSTSALSQQLQQHTTLPSQVIDHGVLHIDGYTAEHPFPYNNNKAVAYGGGIGGGMRHQISSNGKIAIQNGILPFATNSMSANHQLHNQRMNDGIIGGGGIGSGGGFGGHGITRLLPTNDIVAKTPTQDLVNVSTIN